MVFGNWQIWHLTVHTLQGEPLIENIFWEFVWELVKCFLIHFNHFRWQQLSHSIYYVWHDVMKSKVLGKSYLLNSSVKHKSNHYLKFKKCQYLSKSMCRKFTFSKLQIPNHPIVITKFLMGKNREETLKNYFILPYFDKRTWLRSRGLRANLIILFTRIQSSH